MNQVTPVQEAIELDVAIIGAGLGGLYAIHRMRGLGFKTRAFEAGSGIGGTWFWNKYPGARCDIESLEYSYSFDDDLQQEWRWPERYATQPQILAYIQHVAERFDLMRDVQLNTHITEATFDTDINRWILKASNGQIISARFCIMATGNLSTPRVPDFKGIDTFEGKWYHSGMWPAEGVDFTGKRVGVIGTGSSGIQMIPLIAQQAEHLHVFQRTANYCLPARNGPMERDHESAFKADYRKRREEARHSGFGVSGYPAPTQSALDVTEEERRKNYEMLWERGGTIGFLTCYSDVLVNEEANETAAEFVREKIRSTVKDPKVAALLTPTDHPIGTKRLCLDTGYYETYNRPNVSLVDVRSAPIQEITPKGLRTADQEFELDAIVFATGFDAMTGALREIDIRGIDGTRLADKWNGGPTTYLGLMVAGFPNMFIVTGPGSPSVKSQMIHSIEQHIDWVSDLLKTAVERQVHRVEADMEAETNWVSHVNEVADATLYPKANSWYIGANIPGKPRVFMPYVAGVGTYRKVCDEIAADDYRGLKLS
ncbi:NAD(P)/FAD-dependent oxidoreductase [Hwanghaeella grinnelliae]|uniref:NAD(P)/FAD-dependent oxidoreductase n=1 Tax=Hwanghaeella grinnelliae TaxID=2500179 RepID=A0A3S2VP17_9PROT|nr:NAD(P)/FAD-dependent oxidoreductase [Hwanghaeella grinnelliae]RVU35990.1 NAD(P)/FAD-dependent oxidoreductase [Hwanghaeella grinnelliae]